MRRSLLLFLPAAAAIIAAWAWLGAPVAMPATPIAAGEKLYCLSYAPFRGTQNPLDAGTYVSAAQVDEDLARLAKITDCVRTYSIDHGVDQVPALAAKHGLKVIQGIWISSHPDKNRQQIERGIELANQYGDVIRSLVVGNEVLLRGEMTAAGLVAAMREVKSRVSVPVTYADVWEFWLRNPALAEVADFVTIHILPYWEDFPISARDAAAHIDAIHARVAAAFPGKEILIGETGFPSAGRMREGSLPSPSNQALALHEILNTAKAANYRVNLIEAFDQPWKRALEGTVGGYWGLYEDASRAAKFTWGQPVSDHPRWVLQAAAGVAFAAIVFGAGWLFRLPASRPSLSKWIAIALMAAVAGICIGWSAEKAFVESFGAGAWARALLLLAVAAASPLAAAAALVRNRPIPALAEVLGGSRRVSRGRLSLALGLLFAVLCALAVQVALGLVFDPRYKDFPFPDLVSAVLPYCVLAFAWPRPAGERRMAELVAAGTLGLCAAYVAFNEGFANWQAQVFVAALAALTLTLLRLGYTAAQTPR